MAVQHVQFSTVPTVIKSGLKMVKVLDKQFVYPMSFDGSSDRIATIASNQRWLYDRISPNTNLCVIDLHVSDML